nr:hypothetical protein [Tanacetum cinerariifolium]
RRAEPRVGTAQIHDRYERYRSHGVLKGPHERHQGQRRVLAGYEWLISNRLTIKRPVECYSTGRFFMPFHLVASIFGPPCQVYTSVAASDAWMVATQQLPLKQQVAAVHQRLTCDARVRGPVPAAAVCVSCLTAEGQRAYRAAQEKQRQAETADPRPQGFVLFYLINGRVVVPTDTAQWRPLVTRQQVQKIDWLTSEKAVSVAGARAQG